MSQLHRAVYKSTSEIEGRLSIQSGLLGACDGAGGTGVQKAYQQYNTSYKQMRALAWKHAYKGLLHGTNYVGRYYFSL